jgi:DNA primase
LTFWTHGYRNATTMFGQDALTEDMLAAFAEFRIQRVLTPCQAVTDKLLAAGLEVFLIKLPLNTDINAYARQVNDPADALGALLRGAEWVGKGQPSATVSVPFTPDQQPEDAASLDELLEEEKDAADDVVTMTEVESPPTPELPPEPEPPVRTASPVPPPPPQDDAEVREDEVVMTFGNRRYRVRGLTKNTALEVLRVNLFVSNEQGMFVDTFDLYSARHRKAFQDQAALELHVEEQVIKRDLGRLLLKLEEVQDANLQALAEPQKTTPDMTSEEQEAALQLLRDPNLLGRIVDDFAVVGERTNKLVGYLAAVSRKLDQPLAVIIQSTSAAGKTTLMEAILSFVPPEEVVKFSAMTGQSLYYMADGSLQHKILAIVEEEGAQRASYALKLLQSEGELRIASTGKEVSTGRLVTQEYRVEGPVMIFLTTTSIHVDEELLNRCLVLTVDEDRQQTRHIHQIQRRRQTLTGQLSALSQQQTLKLHRNAQRLLKPLLVANPYAERLTFLDDKTRTRRDHLKYLTLIRTVTLLHQHQRPIKTVTHQGQPLQYVEVTLEDIAVANELATEVLGRSLDDLPPQTRRLLNLLESMVTDACRRQGLDRSDYRFTRRDVREYTHWGNTQLKVHLKRLEELEFLLVHRDRDSRRHFYELLYQPPTQAGGKVLAGLIDVEHLRQAEWSAQEEARSGDGRAEVGPESGHSQAQRNGASPDAINGNHQQATAALANANPA